MHRLSKWLVAVVSHAFTPLLHHASCLLLLLLQILDNGTTSNGGAAAAAAAAGLSSSSSSKGGTLPEILLCCICWVLGEYGSLAAQLPPPHRASTGQVRSAAFHAVFNCI
jgi:hypothetical protein